MGRHDVWLYVCERRDVFQGGGLLLLVQGGGLIDGVAPHVRRMDVMMSMPLLFYSMSECSDGTEYIWSTIYYISLYSYVHHAALRSRHLSDTYR